MSVGDRMNVRPGPVKTEQPAGTTPAEQREEVKPVETKGSYKGMEVQVAEDPNSQVADATEELGMSLSETVERKLPDRKVAKREKAAVLPANEAEKAESEAKKLKGMDSEKLKRFLAQLRQNPPTTSDALRERAKQEFEDPTERHLALTALREIAADAGDAELQALADTVLIAMEAEEGPAIRAGYNISQVQVTELGTPQEHRETYRENVLSFKNAGETFSSLKSTYGDAGVGKMLDYMSKSLSADMSSISPSLEPERLAIANDGIATARSILNTLDGANELLKEMARNFPGEQKGKAGGMVDTLFKLKDGQMTSAFELRKSLPMRGRADPTHDVEMLKGFIELARQVPDRLFASPSNRQGMLDLIQTALDEAIALEEKVLDGVD